MSVYSKKNIRVAAKSRSKMPLNSHVVTTNDFGFAQPIFAREVFVGDQANGIVKTFARLAPLPVPSFSNLKIIQRSFYVRYRNVWRGWEDFYAQREHITQSGSQLFETVPTITNADFVYKILPYKLGSPAPYLEAKSNGFVDYVEIDLPVAGVDPKTLRDSLDIVWSYDADVIMGFNFTPAGRRLMSIMRGLGYSINFAITTTDCKDKTPMSLLPMLCYCRIWYDYYLPSKYSNDPIWRSLFETDWLDIDNLWGDVFEYMVNTMYNYYENDYFTSSWINPFSPNGSSSTPGTYIPDFTRVVEGDSTHNISSVFNPDYGSVIYPDKPGGTGVPDGKLPYISQYALDSLKALYDWGTRRGLGGNKYFESIFSQFGIRLPNIMTNRCEFLGADMQSVSISDVMATSQTETKGNITSLGDYAGKGISYSDNCRFNFEANDFGMIIVLSQIVPDTGYVQGRNREVLHLKPTDFFQPEFDCLGMQAIRNDELFADYHEVGEYDAGQAYGGKPDGIFGYTPRYTEYKSGRDLLNGDFRVRHLNTASDSYHCFRLFSPPSGSYPLANTEKFRLIDPSLDGSNFDRIFNERTQVADHFIMEHWIDCEVFRKAKSVQDSFDLDGGQMVSVDPDNNLSN